jgi:hypothetical protein
VSRFVPPTATAPTIAADSAEVRWRNLTEDLIFAAAYDDDPRTGSVTWRRCLDARKIRYNPEDEDRKCRELCAAINAAFPGMRSQIEKAHAASDHGTFRLCHAALLPERP